MTQNICKCCPNSHRQAAEIDRLMAENQILRSQNEKLVRDLKTAVWTDSEQCRLVEAENEKLRSIIRQNCNADVAEMALNGLG